MALLDLLKNSLPGKSRTILHHMSDFEWMHNGRKPVWNYVPCWNLPHEGVREINGQKNSVSQRSASVEKNNGLKDSVGQATASDERINGQKDSGSHGTWYHL